MNQELRTAKLEVQRGQEQLSHALDHLKDKVGDTAHRAEAMVDKARDRAEQVVDKMKTPVVFIKHKPLLAVGSAFAGGFFLGLIYYHESKELRVLRKILAEAEELKLKNQLL